VCPFTSRKARVTAGAGMAIVAPSELGRALGSTPAGIGAESRQTGLHRVLCDGRAPIGLHIAKPAKGTVVDRPRTLGQVEAGQSPA